MQMRRIVTYVQMGKKTDMPKEAQNIQNKTRWFQQKIWKRRKFSMQIMCSQNKKSHIFAITVHTSQF